MILQVTIDPPMGQRLGDAPRRSRAMEASIFREAPQKKRDENLVVTTGANIHTKGGKHVVKTKKW